MVQTRTRRGKNCCSVLLCRMNVIVSSIVTWKMIENRDWLPERWILFVDAIELDGIFLPREIILIDWNIVSSQSHTFPSKTNDIAEQ